VKTLVSCLLSLLISTLILSACGGVTEAERYYNTGVAFQEQGRHQDAIAQYDEAIRLDQNYAWAYINRGTAYKDIGQCQRSIEDYSTAIHLDPEADVKATAYNNRGFAHWHLSQFEQAAKDYDQAIHLDPDCAICYANRAMAYTMFGMDVEAQQDINRVVELGFDPSVYETEIERLKKQR